MIRFGGLLNNALRRRAILYLFRPMKKIHINLLAFLLCAIGFSACEKDYGPRLAPLQDAVAPIPITVVNQEYFERFPVVTTKVDTAAGAAKSTGTFSIELSIPADKGKIKEITKVGTGNSGVLYVQDNRYPNYLGAPVAGNGSNKITFTSNLNEVRDYDARLSATFKSTPSLAVKNPAFTFTGTSLGKPGTLTPNANLQTPNQLRYFFLVTLEDGTQLISTEVDVRLLK